jgi:hypothetical protein
VNAAVRRHLGTRAALVVLAMLLVACGSTTDAQEVAPAATQEAPEPQPEPEPEPEPEPVGTAPLTGVEVFDADELETLEQRPAVVVKVPNDPDARPHTGLEAADVVYEQETEGGVTRFAAVFHSAYPEVVGNVRSGRFVDVPLVAPYDGIMIYSGARAAVQARIDEAGLTRVTEGGPGFYRDSSRRAPHNLYIRLPQAAAARDANPAAASPWHFDAEPPAGGRELTGRVQIATTRTAVTGWEYDDEATAFRRFQNGAAHTVTGEGRIAADNVVVLDVPVSGRDSHGAPVYELAGSGAALLLRDGRAYDIGWSKEGVHSPLHLVDGADTAALRPGSTWVVLSYGGALEGISGIAGPADG